MFRPALFLVWAAEGKTGLLLVAFIIGFLDNIVPGLVRCFILL